MSPFAGYESFDACVSDNQDANDPESYCARIHKEATGEWPGQKAFDSPEAHLHALAAGALAHTLADRED